MTYQYETNLWSTHVNIVRLAEPFRRCIRWRTQVFKIEGFVCKRFFPSFPSPSPSPLFHFLALFSFLVWPTRESRSSVFLCSETKPKRLLRRLVKWVLHFLRLGRRRNLTPVYSNIFEAASISLFWAQQITQQITGNAFQISLERDWQIDSGFFNRPIMARTLA